MSESDVGREREIVLAVLTGEASELERRLLRARRQADPDFDREVEAIERVWSAAKKRGGIVDESTAPPLEAIIAGGTPLSWPAADAPARRRRTGRWAFGAIAASLLVAIGIGVLTFGSRSLTDPSAQVVITGVDEVVTVRLDDGTLVRVAPDSRLEFGSTRRAVVLTGRAFFAVAHRAGDPFRVRLPERTITVLGTRFDAEGRGGQSRVAVVEGTVRISGGGTELTARRDEVAFGPDSGALVIHRVDDIYQTIDWLGTFLAFESTPLIQVAEELGDRFGLRISVADSSLGARTVTGWFSDQTRDGIIAAICTAVGARCVMDGEAVQMDHAAAADRPAGVDGSRP